MVIKDFKRSSSASRSQMVRLTPQPLEMRPRVRRTGTTNSTDTLGAASPTTSIVRVFLTLAIAVVVSLLFSAQGIVHSADGMPDGPARAITVAIGNSALQVAEAAHLTGPWNLAQDILGHQNQPAVAPLLVTAPVRRAKHSAHPASTGTTAAVTAGKSGHAHAHRGAPLGRFAGIRKRRGAPPSRIPSAANPLRLLVTGDSLSGYLGPELLNEAAHVGQVRGFVDTHDGTGLTRPDFVDWSVVARQQVTADNPDAVVVLLGGNDFQNMTLPGGKFFAAGSPSWTREYQRRAAICMRIWTQNGKRRVYWLAMPPARDSTWAYVDAHINIALRRAAATVRGAEFVNILGPITDRGRYADFVNVNGLPTLIREPDGVHLNVAGSLIVAHEVLPILTREWHLGFKPHRRQTHRKGANPTHTGWQ